MNQNTPGQIADLIDNSQASAEISAMLNGEKTRENVVVETHEDAHREIARRYNLDKNTILSTLLNREQLGTKDAYKTKSLSQLFVQYFKGVISHEYTIGDLARLRRLLADETDPSAVCHVEIPARPKVKKGLYEGHKGAALYLHTLKEMDAVQPQSIHDAETPINGAAQTTHPKRQVKQVIIGASRGDCAIYFVFTNEKSDVNNGTVYIRNGAFRVLERYKTFEINPFVRGRGIVTDPETGATEVKDQLTFNPNWLAATVDNMETHIFAWQVYTPPKPVRVPKHERAKEVDVNSLIEKTLAKANSDTVQVDAAKMAGEVREGIDNYHATAMAEIAKRSGVSGMQDGIDNPVLKSSHETLTAACRNANQEAQRGIRGEGVIHPDMEGAFGQPVQDSSYAERVIADNHVHEDIPVVSETMAAKINAEQPYAFGGEVKAVSMGGSEGCMGLASGKD